MSENITTSDNQLRKAFRRVPREPLPDRFVENLMPEIENAAVRKRKMNAIVGFLQLLAGVAGILLLPALAIYLCKLFIPDFSFSLTEINISLNSNAVLIGFAVLLLLIIDSLFRTLHSRKS
jgi:hypothetical protein